MVQRSPASDDPTSEEEALEFDGTKTDQLDDTYRLRVVTASENGNGSVGFDDRGQPQWRWITQLAPTAGDATGTFDQLKALDNPALSLREEESAKPKRPTQSGYDPYSTGVFAKPKLRR